EVRHDLREDLAMTYMARGNTLIYLGRRGEALADHIAAIDLYEELVHLQGHRELAGNLAWAYAGHAEILLGLGRREEACQRARKALSILQNEVSCTATPDLQRALALAEEVARNACD